MADDEIDYIQRKRWWLKPLLFIAALVVLGTGAYLAYRRWEPDRLAKQARTLFENGDYDNGFLSLRRALQINPNNEAAARAIAEVTSQMNSPASLAWHRRVAEMNPDSAPEAFDWASTAVRMGRTTEAEQALAAVPEKERGTARYQALKGTLALNAGKMADAEKAFQEAVRLEPTSPYHQYNLATLHLQSTDAAKRDPALATLKALVGEKAVQSLARRTLVTYLMEQKDFPAALEYNKALLIGGEEIFSDRLVHLELLSRSKPEEVANVLPNVQAEAAKRPENASSLMHWMRTHELTGEALSWMDTFDSRIASSPDVAAARAEILIRTKDWSALEKFASDGHWQAMDYLRLASLARAERELQNTTASRNHWRLATAAASREHGSIVRIASIAQEWGWKEEWREALWAGAFAPSPQWALKALERSYQKDRDSAGLLRVARRIGELDPVNEGARNNIAMLSLLRGEQLDTALRTAQTLYQKSPANPAFASTYAFALHLHGRTEEALAIFQKVDPAYLQHPTMAAHYAILLAANGENEAAKPFLKIANQADLLPEEKALVAKAVEKATKEQP